MLSASSVTSFPPAALREPLALSLCIARIEQLISRIDSSGEPLQSPLRYLQLSDARRYQWRQLHLSLALIQEEPALAMECLQSIGLENRTLTALRLGAQLYQGCFSTAMIEEVFATADNLNMDTENRIFLYELILAIEPFHFESYRKLISLITDSNKKRALLEEAAENAYINGEVEIERQFREQLEARGTST